MTGKHAARSGRRLPSRGTRTTGPRQPGRLTGAWQPAPPASNGQPASNGRLEHNREPGNGTAIRSVRDGRDRGGGPAPARGAIRVRRIPIAPGTAAGLVMIGLLVLFCYAGPLVYHANIVKVNLLSGNRPPGPGHPLGTDGDGLDVLGLLMAGGRISLEVGIAAGLLAAAIGSGWGAVAGYIGGPLDALMMRVVDAAVAIPTLVLLLLLSAIYTPSPGILVLVIAATSWLSTAYLVRGAALTLRSREYVQAVRLMGGGRIRAIVRHIAPNALGVITVNVSIQVADAILALATLSYLGLGVRPPASDWGDMVAGGIRYIYDGYWWEIYPAGIAIIVAVVAFNLLGDGLRDSLAGPGLIR